MTMTAHFAPSTQPVLVGVDGSASALDAVRWGATEARRRRVPLRLVTTFAYGPDQVVAMPALGDQVRDELVAVARRHLVAAAEIAERTAPGVEVTRDVLNGYPIGVLVDVAGQAQLLVLGSRGLGGLTGLLLGSVAVGTAAGAPCPVVVVRGASGAEAAARPVVVGVDGTPNSEAAVAFAYEAAAARAVPLVALHTWVDIDFSPGLAPVTDWPAIAEKEEILLAERLAGWGEKYPDVEVRRVLARDGAARALVELSTDAQLVVVGSRGRSTFTSLLLGSVSHAVLHRSHCPVAVVRPDTATTTGSG
jgi:nucleotide-binding universal stress UspA family protein